MVLRLTDSPLARANVGPIADLEGVEFLPHTLNRCVMRIWCRMLLTDAPAQGFNIEENILRAHVDVAKDDYYILEPAQLESDRVIEGVRCIYIMQVILY